MELLELLKKDIPEKYIEMIEGKTKNINTSLRVDSPEPFISNYNTILNRLDAETQSINKRLDYIAKMDRKNRKEKRKEENYKKAIEMFETSNYSEANQMFDVLNGYKDSSSYISKCQQAINNQVQEQNRIKEEEKRRQIEEQHLALQKARIEAEEKEKRHVRNKSMAIVFVSILVIVGLVIILLQKNNQNSNNNINSNSNSNSTNNDVQNNEQYSDNVGEADVLDDLVRMAGQEAILPDQCEYFSYSTNETIAHRSSNYKCFFMDIYVPDEEVNTFTDNFRQKLLNNDYQELNSNCYQKGSTVIFFTEPELYENVYSIGYYAFIE